MIDIYYKKNDNTELFNNFKDIGILNSSNFIPIYTKFFNLTENNFNSINLDQPNFLKKIKLKDNSKKSNIYDCEINNHNNSNKIKTETFLKFSPLLDPIKYMSGKYKDITEEKKCTLPTLTNKDMCLKKYVDVNNSAYVDSFFTYLTSKMLNEKKFIHGIDFYGSFLSLKKEFNVDIYDDLEFLDESEYFHENKNKIFKISNDCEDMFFESNTRNYRKKIKISDYDIEDNSCNNIFSDLDIGIFNDVFVDNSSNEIINLSDLSNNSNLIFENFKNSDSRSTKSNCSSRSSHTSNEESDDNNDTESDVSIDEYTDDETDNTSESSEGDCIATIDNYPVQVISLEKMDATLDSLLEDELDIDEWKSCLFQIIITLTTYQKIFSLTHNDLHTNNIMFIKTEKEYIIYKYNGKHYKVPTYGRLFKIIDFGRAIYKYKNNIICSDSFHENGDAATQYNCEPYFNKNKSRLEPNFSFDLCRLGCSLYDYFKEILDDEFDKNPISNLIDEWCKDDKGRNILYKKCGEERYPDFKLYKMIARTVNKHVPKDYIDIPLFSKFQTSKKNIGKRKVINIDEYKECY
tara:strand:+ start:7192 stop:8916 length:1725 start_codon:yes stop_codon:yes gene_type:complete